MLRVRGPRDLRKAVDHRPQVGLRLLARGHVAEVHVDVAAARERVHVHPGVGAWVKVLEVHGQPRRERPGVRLLHHRSPRLGPEIPVVAAHQGALARRSARLEDGAVREHHVEVAVVRHEQVRHRVEHPSGRGHEPNRRGVHLLIGRGRGVEARVRVQSDLVRLHSGAEDHYNFLRRRSQESRACSPTSQHSGGRASLGKTPWPRHQKSHVWPST